MSPNRPKQTHFSLGPVYRAVLEHGFPAQVLAAGGGVTANVANKEDVRTRVPLVLTSAAALGNGVVVI